MIWLIGLIQASCVFIFTFFLYFGFFRFFPGTIDPKLVTVLSGVMFVFAVIMYALIVFAYPLYLFASNKILEGIKIVSYTALFPILFLVLVVMYMRTLDNL